MTQSTSVPEVNPKKYKLRGWIRVGSGINFHINIFQAPNAAEDARRFSTTITDFLRLEEVAHDVDTMFEFWGRLPKLKKIQIPGIELETNGGAVPSCGLHVGVVNEDWENCKNVMDAPLFYISFTYERGGWAFETRSFNRANVVPDEAHELVRRLRALKDEL